MSSLTIKFLFAGIVAFFKDWYQSRLAIKIDILNQKRDFLDEDKISVDVDLRSVITTGPGSEKKFELEVKSRKLTRKIRRLEIRLMRLKSRYYFTSGIDPDRLEEEAENIVRIDNRKNP